MSVDWSELPKISRVRTVLDPPLPSQPGKPQPVHHEYDIGGGGWFSVHVAAGVNIRIIATDPTLGGRSGWSHDGRSFFDADGHAAINPPDHLMLARPSRKIGQLIGGFSTTNFKTMTYGNWKRIFDENSNSGVFRTLNWPDDANTVKDGFAPFQSGWLYFAMNDMFVYRQNPGPYYGYSDNGGLIRIDVWGAKRETDGGDK